MNFKEDLGKLIKATRQARELTQEELGAECGVHKAQISKIEKDITCSSIEVFLKICEVLGLEIHQGKPQRQPSRYSQVFIIPAALTGKSFHSRLLQDLKYHLEIKGFNPSERILKTNYSIAEQSQEFQKILHNKKAYLGGIVVPVTPERVGETVRQFLKSFRRPVVFIDRIPFDEGIPYPPNAAFVGFDNKIGGRLAAEAIVFESISRNKSDPHVLVIGSRSQTQRQEEFVSYLRTLLPNAPPPTVNIQGEFQRDKAQQIVARYLKESQSCGIHYDMVFCTNDDMALGAIDAISWFYKASEEAPIVIGYDAIDEAISIIKNGRYMKNSVRQSTLFLAEKAVEILSQMINCEPFQLATLLEPELYNSTTPFIPQPSI